MLYLCTGAALRLARREAARSFEMAYALLGKTALVTGANRGIGEALVDALVAAGGLSTGGGRCENRSHAATSVQ